MTTDTPDKTNVIQLRPDPSVHHPRRYSDFVSWYNAGFHDLIPVTPPLATIAAHSKLEPQNLGKAPGLRIESGNWTGFPYWRQHKTTRDDVEAWREWLCNAGISCYSFSGVDIDIADPTEQVAIDICRKVALQELGPAPSRTGKAPKELRLYRVTSPVRKMQLHFRRTGKTDEKDIHLVEVLGAGQQFVIEGTHPSGSLYTWDRDPRHGGPESLSEVTPEQLERFMQTLGVELAKNGYELVSKTSSRIDRDEVDQESLVDPDLDRIERAVKAIPNNNEDFGSRTAYIRMGIAIKAAFRDDPQRGLEVFQEWASRWPGNGKVDGNDDAQVERDWNSLKPPFAIGASYLIGTAFQFNHQETASEFSVASMFEDISGETKEAILAEALNWTKTDLATMGERLTEIVEHWPGILDQIVDVCSFTNGLTRDDFEKVMKLGVDVSCLELWPASVIIREVPRLLKEDAAGTLPLPLAGYLFEWHRRGTLSARRALAIFGLAISNVRGRPFNGPKVRLFAEAAFAVYNAATPIVEFAPSAAVLKRLMAHSPLIYSDLRDLACAYPDWKGRGSRSFDEAVSTISQAYERSLRETQRMIEEPMMEDDRPIIRFDRSNQDKLVTEAMSYLTSSGITLQDSPVFQYGRKLVTVVKPLTIPHGKNESNLFIKGHDISTIRFKLLNTVRIQKYVPQGQLWVDDAVSDEFAKMILAVGPDTARPLTGIVNTPVVGPNGILIDTEGYNESTGLFVDFAGVDFNVPGIERSREAARWSYHWLAKVLFEGFEFASPMDETIAVSALLSLLVRRLIGQAPGYVMQAPVQSSGKTTLVQVIAMAMLGANVPAASWPPTEEEFGKRVVGWLREGISAILLDNLSDGMMVNSSELSRVLTMPVYKGRILGGNDEAILPTNVVWFLTGNGLTVSRDLATRLLPCNLEPTSDSPHRRTFRRVDPVAWALENRLSAVHHALTIILSYMDAKNGGGGLQRGTRFQEWDELVRQPLLWLFDGDPERDIGRRFDQKVAEDEASNPKEALMRALRTRFGINNAFTLDTLHQIVTDGGQGMFGSPSEANDAVRECFIDIYGDKRLSTVRIRKILTQLVGRVAHGMKLTEKPDNGTMLYKFIGVT